MKEIYISESITIKLCWVGLFSRKVYLIKEIIKSIVTARRVDKLVKEIFYRCKNKKELFSSF